MEEIFETIPMTSNKYQVSNFGNVKSLKRKEPIILSKNITHVGYYYVSICINGIFKKTTIHKLVATMFIPNPENKKTVNHIDGNKKNNRVDNLEWNTYAENNAHAKKLGLSPMGKGEQNPLNTPVLMLNQEGKILKKYCSSRDASRHTGVHHCNILRVCKNKRITAGGYKWKFANV